MIDLIFDTETTGFYDKHADLTAPQQPHMLQLAALLCEGDTVLSRFVTYTKPIGEYRIPLEAARIHGITHELIDKAGIDTILALTVLKQMLWRAERVVCHNLDFDMMIVKIATARSAKTWSMPEWVKTYCTMEATTPICKLPGKVAGKYKWPKLIEAYKMFIDPNGFEGEHDALADVTACHKLLVWLDGMNKSAEPKPAIAEGA